MNTVYLSLGSNLGDKMGHLLKACDALEHCGLRLTARSPVYESEALTSGKDELQPNYLNQVLRAETELGPKDLLSIIRGIEKRLGRVRNRKWAPRTIDIDILFFNNEIREEEELTLPHPELCKRRFVLEPLYRIAPKLPHPVNKRTIEELLQTLSDPLALKLHDNKAQAKVGTKISGQQRKKVSTRD